MLDINLIREKPSFVRKNLERRKDKLLVKQLDELVKIDEEWRKRQYHFQELVHKKNSASLEINKLKKEGESFRAGIKEIRELGRKIEGQQQELADLKLKVKSLLMHLPNLMHESVPYGRDETGNKEMRKFGAKPKFDFPLKSHVELAENLCMADFERSSKISGSGFAFLKGDLALLNQALIRFGVDKLLKKGFTLIDPPLMMARRAYEGVTDLADFEKVMYKVENEDSYLIATSEHPMCAMHMDEVIPEEMLPLKYVGLSINFRKEAGSHGIDEKGLFRRHQFWKVEQFVFCKPEDSWKIHEGLEKNAEEIFKELEIPYRVVNICTADLGIVAAKKYDLEAWMPRSNAYKEVGSCSNCTDYQARRLNIKYGTEGGEKQLVHTLNSTAIATSRVLVAILENFQNRDGSVSIPKALWPYMSGIKKLAKKK